MKQSLNIGDLFVSEVKNEGLNVFYVKDVKDGCYYFQKVKYYNDSCAICNVEEVLLNPKMYNNDIMQTYVIKVKK